jgi:hypothetical protein
MLRTRDYSHTFGKWEAKSFKFKLPPYFPDLDQGKDPDDTEFKAQLQAAFDKAVEAAKKEIAKLKRTRCCLVGPRGMRLSPTCRRGGYARLLMLGVGDWVWDLDLGWSVAGRFDVEPRSIGMFQQALVSARGLWNGALSLLMLETNASLFQIGFRLGMIGGGRVHKPGNLGALHV